MPHPRAQPGSGRPLPTNRAEFAASGPCDVTDGCLLLRIGRSSAPPAAPWRYATPSGCPIQGASEGWRVSRGGPGSPRPAFLGGTWPLLGSLRPRRGARPARSTRLAEHRVRRSSSQGIRVSSAGRPTLGPSDGWGSPRLPSRGREGGRCRPARGLRERASRPRASRRWVRCVSFRNPAVLLLREDEHAAGIQLHRGPVRVAVAVGVACGLNVDTESSIGLDTQVLRAVGRIR